MDSFAGQGIRRVNDRRDVSQYSSTFISSALRALTYLDFPFALAISVTRVPSAVFIGSSWTVDRI